VRLRLRYGWLRLITLHLVAVTSRLPHTHTLGLVTVTVHTPTHYVLHVGFPAAPHAVTHRFPLFTPHGYGYGLDYGLLRTVTFAVTRLRFPRYVYARCTHARTRSRVYVHTGLRTCTPFSCVDSHGYTHALPVTFTLKAPHVYGWFITFCC